MRILIAGATGAIGRRLIPLLGELGHEPVALVHTTPPQQSDLQTVTADALDRPALTASVSEYAPEVVVNLLTAIPRDLNPRRFEQQFAKTNRLRTEGTANLIAAAPGARLISEGLAFAYSPAGGPLADSGRFSFIHTADAATAIVAAVDRPHVTGALNIVDDEPAAVADWLPGLARLLGAPQPKRVPAWVARLLAGVAYMNRLVGADNTRARQALDWRPRYRRPGEGFKDVFSAGPAPARR